MIVSHNALEPVMINLASGNNAGRLFQIGLGSTFAPCGRLNRIPGVARLNKRKMM
jgi:hypothetical protein